MAKACAYLCRQCRFIDGFGELGEFGKKYRFCLWLEAGRLLATVRHLSSAYILILNVVLNRTFSKYFSAISF